MTRKEKSKKPRLGFGNKRWLCLVLVLIAALILPGGQGGSLPVAWASPQTTTITIHRTALAFAEEGAPQSGQAGVSFRLWPIPEGSEYHQTIQKFIDTDGNLTSDGYEQVINDLNRLFGSEPAKFKEDLGQPVDTDLTNKEGDTKIDLPHGFYYVREKDNNLKSQAYPFLLVVPGSGTVTPKVRTWSDEPQLTRVTLKKVDENGKALEGVGFELHEAAGPDGKAVGTQLTLAKTQQGHYYAEPDQVNEASGWEPVSTLYTDAQGEIQVEGLPAGDYIFLEVKPLAGYTVDNPARAFEITTAAQPVEVRMVNTSGGGYHFFKYDQESRKGLEGAVFRVLKLSTDEKKWLNPDGTEAKDKDDPSQMTVTSGADGHFAVQGLAYEGDKGTLYYLYEMKSPSGFRPAVEGQVYSFRVNADSWMQSLDSDETGEDQSDEALHPLISIPNEKLPPSTPPTTDYPLPPPPKTGDYGITPWILVALALAMILVYMQQRKKQAKKREDK